MIIPDVHGESSSLIRSIFANAFYVFGSQPKTCVSSIYPIGPMYGIYANIWGILMVNVTIYRIHGSYGYLQIPNFVPKRISNCGWVPNMEIFWKKVSNGLAQRKQGPEIDCPKYGLVNTQTGPIHVDKLTQILPGKRIFVVIHSEFCYEFRYVSPPVSPKMPIVHWSSHLAPDFLVNSPFIVIVPRFYHAYRNTSPSQNAWRTQWPSTSINPLCARKVKNLHPKIELNVSPFDYLTNHQTKWAIYTIANC